MINSILQFQEEGTKNLSKIFETYTNDLSKVAEMVYGVTTEVTKLGLQIIAEEWESYDELLRERKDLRKGWEIVRKDRTTLTTSLGDVVYSKTLFRNKQTGRSCYLLDQLMGIERHARMTEDALARIFDEAVDSSYRKGGKNACITGGSFSKETVMNKVHDLNFPKVEAHEKRHRQFIYIDADEDHVALQFREKKGDIGHPRSNTIMPRIVYVYEGVDFDNECRPKLINAKYFGGVYEGADGVQQLWKDVLEYLENAYEMDSVERIYVNGDGAFWIRSGAHMLPNAKFVLDKYHMHKYIIAATSHLGDSCEDARNEIYRAIKKRTKWMMQDVFERILYVTESETKQKAVIVARNYLSENWSGIMLAMNSKDKNVQCSAEGHVSHVFSDRMSSRPMGWSKLGVDKMSRLRIYKQNNGNMLELVRYQKCELPLVAGAEEVIYSAQNILNDERKQREKLGVLYRAKIYSIPYTQIKKIAALKNHIWDL